MRASLLSLLLSAAVILPGCERKPDSHQSAAGGSSTSPKKDDHAGHDHSAGPSAKPGDAHGDDVIELGTANAGDLVVRAARERGELKAGGDAPIDIWLTTADGKPAPAVAVRFWIGTEDAKGALKAKAEIENSAQPNHWHTHVEVPEPIPGTAKLWVEIEPTRDVFLVCSFDLKP